MYGQTLPPQRSLTGSAELAARGRWTNGQGPIHRR
jgi:hypothetical protein